MEGRNGGSCQKISEGQGRNVDGGWVRDIGADARESFSCSEGPFELPANWFPNYRGSLWHGAESWRWSAWYKASEKRLLCYWPVLVFPWTSDALPLLPFSVTELMIPLQHQSHYFLWGPSPVFSVSPQSCLLSPVSLHWVLMLSSESTLFLLSMFPYQTTVISPKHQTRNSGSPKEYPYTHVGVFLDSWKASVDPALKNDGGKRMAPRVKNWGPGPAPPFAQLCPFQHAQLSPATLSGLGNPGPPLQGQAKEVWIWLSRQLGTGWRGAAGL